jgi:hypothetical protein
LLRVIIGLLLNDLSGRGNYLNLLARLKGVNNKGINKGMSILMFLMLLIVLTS